LVEEIKYPSLEQVSKLYDRTIDATGGERGYLSTSNLEYLLDTVKDVGERLPRRQAIIKKAASLLYNVIIVHPFLNGKKRTEFGLMEVSLESNGYEASLDTAEGFGFLIGVASGKVSESKVEHRIARHSAEPKEKCEEDGPEPESSEADT
jgi:death on curing protein